MAQIISSPRISGAPPATSAATPGVTLRILATTDLHAQIYPFDYYNDRPNDAVGLARTATLVRQARLEAANSVLLDNGDFLQGNPLADYVAQECGLNKGQTHPVIAAMNALGYDAATLGNHEFDYGVAFLMRALSGADFPLVSANILTHKGSTPAGDKSLVRPYVLLDKKVIDEKGQPHILRIGLTGFAPPQATLWDIQSRSSAVFTREIVQSAQALIPEMKRQGADIIIALAHSGIHTANETASFENASIALAAIAGIDAVIAGHTHQVFPCERRLPQPEVDASEGKLHNKPAVMAGSLGAHLGVIDLRLHRINGRWLVKNSHVETRPIFATQASGAPKALVANDPEVARAAAYGHAKTLDHIHRPIGNTTGALHSYFAQLTNEATMALVTDAQLQFARHALADGAHSQLPVLSAAAPVKVGGRGGANNYVDIPAGGLAIRHVADLYYYPDMLSIVKITGAQLRQWLERSTGAFHQITQGRNDQPLLDLDFPCYFFDVIKGVTYQIDLSHPPRYDHSGSLQNAHAARIANLCFQGQPVSDDMQFAVATNSYRAAGGGRFCGATSGNIIYEARKTNRDIIRDHIARTANFTPNASPIWSFTPMPNTSVLFETGPGARAHIADIADLPVQDIGTSASSFAQFRLAL